MVCNNIRIFTAMNRTRTHDIFSCIRMLFSKTFIQIMNGIHHLRCCINCINSPIRFTPVTGFSMNMNLHTVDHRRSLSLVHCHSQSHICRIMKHKKCICFGILQCSSLNHPFCSLADFLCRFKKKTNPYRKIPLFFCHDLCKNQS